MGIYRIQRKEGNYFRYRMIAGRIFIPESAEKETINGIICVKGKILLYGTEPAQITLPESILEPLKPLQEANVLGILGNMNEYPSLLEAAKEIHKKTTEFLSVAKKLGITDFREIWYKDTLYNHIKNAVQEEDFDKDLFTLIGKTMYRFDLMTEAMENLTLLEDYVLGKK